VRHPQELRLGTRGSQLALWQAKAVAQRIAGAGGPPCRIVVIKTSGDRLQDAPLSSAGGKRLFVKEIEDALLAGEVDLAVHSSKDMPIVLPDGLTLAAVLPREDPLDAIVLPVANNSASARGHSTASHGETMTSVEDLVARLGQSPVLGTASVRRVSQLSRLFSAARFEPIRGNLDTRLRKLDGGGYDGLVLAAAGLRRLGFDSRISFTLPVSACVPAPGQGIVAIEIREGDPATRQSVRRADDAATNAALTAERAVVEALGGGCQTPIGALASAIDDRTIELMAIVVALDGSRAVRAHARGAVEEAEALGRSVGAQLLADGAGDILAEAARHGAPAATHPS
jgi:hydroxymethylbilane synthase